MQATPQRLPHTGFAELGNSRDLLDMDVRRPRQEIPASAFPTVYEGVADYGSKGGLPMWRLPSDERDDIP